MIKIKNWKLALLSLVFISLLTSLGFWQLSRAKQKEALLSNYQIRTGLTPFVAQDLNQIKIASCHF